MEYNYDKLQKLSQRYLKGKTLQIEQKQQLRNAYMSLFKHSPVQELSLVIQSLKCVKDKAMVNEQYQVVVSANAKISTIMRDLMKTQQKVYGQAQNTNNEAVRHLKPLYPNLTNDQQIAKAAAMQLAQNRIRKQ